MTWLNIINIPENSDFLALMLSKQLNPWGSKDPQSSSLCPNSQQTELWIPVNTRCNVIKIIQNPLAEMQLILSSLLTLLNMLKWS